MDPSARPGNKSFLGFSTYNRVAMLQEESSRLEALVDAGIALAAESNLDILLSRIADLARQVVRAAYGAVGVVGPGGELTRFVYSGIDEETARRIGRLPTGEGVLGVVLEQAHPLRLKEISEHPRSSGFPPHHPVMHSFLGAPIVVRGRVFGRLYLSEKEGGAEFSEGDERIAMMLAAQAGVAIENVFLYDEVQARGVELGRRLTQLASFELVARMLLTESSSTGDVLEFAADQARFLTGGTMATLMILDETTGELVIRHAVGGEGAAGLVGVRLEPGTSKSHSVMLRRDAELVPDLANDREINEGVRHVLGNPADGAFAPLLVRDRPIGALAVYGSSEGRPFTDDDLSVLQILANQAAIALENDRLNFLLRNLAVLEERERISKELHDGVIQSIYSVGLNLQGALSLMSAQPERDIDSTPPARPTPSSPARIACATWIVQVSDDAQKRLTVAAGTESGKPAAKAAHRAMSPIPSCATFTQPAAMSSIRSKSMPTRSQAHTIV